MKRVEGKTVIVTGGGAGIGRAVCQVLGREGAKVAVTDLQDREGHHVVKEITEAGGIAEFWHLDVTSEEAVRKVFGAVRERFGRIDVLVNNAGIAGTDKPTDELTEQEWDEVMAVNVKGVFFCT